MNLRACIRKGGEGRGDEMVKESSGSYGQFIQPILECIVFLPHLLNVVDGRDDGTVKEATKSVHAQRFLIRIFYLTNL